jgi:hypothetical protein
MDKYVRLGIAGVLSWVGLSAFLTNGQNLWVGWNDADIVAKALAALAAFHVAPYIPDLGIGNAGGVRTAAADLMLRGIMIGGAAYGAMTGMAASREALPDWRVGTAAGGLVAAWMAWRTLQGRPIGPSTAPGAPSSAVAAQPGAAEVHQALTVLARARGLPPPAANMPVVVRYGSADGRQQFVDVAPRA